MTFQERWAEGMPVGPEALLTPEYTRLCRAYLTLWEKAKEQSFKLARSASCIDTLEQARQELEKRHTDHGIPCPKCGTYWLNEGEIAHE